MKTYTDQEIKKVILDSLHFVAPEIDLNSIKPNAPFRDQMDIDSIDFVRFIIRLHQTLDIEILETDYPKLTSVKSCSDYIKEQTK